MDASGSGKNWRSLLAKEGTDYTMDTIFDFATKNHLENLIAVDNTANEEFVAHYFALVEHGFDLVSSNKIANTLGFDYYQLLRDELGQHQKQYLYETNVGAGLPLIDTIKLLHLSGENITRIKGVFSGSLSYIFNTFSEIDVPFQQVLKDAMLKGYTEPDPRRIFPGTMLVGSY